MKLTPRQDKAAALIAAGMTPGQVAAAVDVDPKTLYRWRQLPAFKARQNREREQILENMRDALRGLGTKAIQRLAALLDSIDEATGLKAVGMVLDQLQPLSETALMAIGSSEEEFNRPSNLGVVRPYTTAETLEQAALTVFEEALDGKTTLQDAQKLLNLKAPLTLEEVTDMVRDGEKLSKWVAGYLKRR